MTTTLYAKGGAKSIRMVFTQDDVNTDPSAVTLKVQLPDGTDMDDVSLVEMEKVEVGIYRYTISPLPQSGEYKYRIEATFSGVNQATLDDTFIVSRTVF